MSFINNLIEIFGSATFWVKALEMMLALNNEFDCEALIHMEPMGAEDQT